MTRTIKISALAIGMMALVMTGCKKEATKSVITETAPKDEANIEVLTIQAEENNDQMEARYNANNDDITIDNDGIAADYSVEPEDIDADENATDAATAARKKIRANSFIHCLRKADLDKDQIRKIRHALGEFKDCKASATKRARTIYAELYAKYKTLAEEQTKLYKAGKITKEEYEARIKRIRNAFSKELRELQLKEKLNTAFQNCYKHLLRKLNGVLSESQWKAFVHCYRRV